MTAALRHTSPARPLTPLGGPYVVVDLLGLELVQTAEIEDANRAMREDLVEKGAIAVVRTIDGRLMGYVAPEMVNVKVALERALRAAKAWSDVRYERAGAKGVA